MSLLNDLKVDLIRRETVQRYKESPGSVDESLLILLDLKTTSSLQEIYQRLSEDEHPIFSRDSWISDAAARMTVDGYWEWVVKRVEAGGYMVNGSYFGRVSDVATLPGSPPGAPLLDDLLEAAPARPRRGFQAPPFPTFQPGIAELPPLPPPVMPRAIVSGVSTGQPFAGLGTTTISDTNY